MGLYQRIAEKASSVPATDEELDRVMLRFMVRTARDALVTYVRPQVRRWANRDHRHLPDHMKAAAADRYLASFDRIIGWGDRDPAAAGVLAGADIGRRGASAARAPERYVRRS